MASGQSHQQCWTGERYEHVCQVPSGRACVDCGAPAGTWWGPCWCPDCDVARLDRIFVSLDEIRSQLGAGVTGPTGQGALDMEEDPCAS